MKVIQENESRQEQTFEFVFVKFWRIGVQIKAEIEVFSNIELFDEFSSP